MATFTSKPTIVDSPAATVAEKFSDLSAMQKVLDQIPADERAKIGDIALTPDSIVMKTPQVGDITLKVTQRTPERVTLTAMGSPVPMNLSVNIKPLSDTQTELTTSMDVEIPAFLKPMVGGTLQKAVDQFGQLMQRLA
ncbi:MAG: SRPBCC family protein [Muribaculaceae bacterium]|nr:SRPBCC family protein [Muribaculaceae bacterium]MCI9053986.1 SRPBCC family protein [Muribaculaceae bacterium]